MNQKNEKTNYEPYQNPGQKFKQAKNDLQKMSEFWVKTEKKQ